MKHLESRLRAAFTAGSGAVAATAAAYGAQIDTIPPQADEVVRALFTSGGSSTWYSRRSGATVGSVTGDMTVPDLVRIVVSVDPPGGGDEIGIVAMGLGADEKCYVLEATRLRGSPTSRAALARWLADLARAIDEDAMDADFDDLAHDRGWTPGA